MRLPYELTQEFLRTGVVPAMLGEFWASAFLNPLGYESYSDLTGLEHSSDAPVTVLGEHYPESYLDPMSDDHMCLCEFPFDHLPGGNECDDDDDWFGDDVEHRS